MMAGVIAYRAGRTSRAGGSGKGLAARLLTGVQPALPWLALRVWLGRERLAGGFLRDCPSARGPCYAVLPLRPSMVMGGRLRLPP